MEGMHRVRHGERGTELPCSLRGPLPPNLYVLTNPEAPQTMSFWVFLEASLRLIKSLAVGD